jgi:hypothetical protein
MLGAIHLETLLDKGFEKQMCHQENQTLASEIRKL